MDNTKVLRASRIGSLCNRSLFYSVNGAEEIISEKSQRIFEVGRTLEPLIINWLRYDGWNVRHNLFLNSNDGMSLTPSQYQFPSCLVLPLINTSSNTVEKHSSVFWSAC